MWDPVEREGWDSLSIRFEKDYKTIGPPMMRRCRLLYLDRSFLHQLQVDAKTALAESFLKFTSTRYLIRNSMANYLSPQPKQPPAIHLLLG